MMFEVMGQLPILLWALFFRPLEPEKLHTTSSWQSQWFFEQCINFLNLISTLTVRFNGNFRSCEKKAHWEAYKLESAYSCTQHRAFSTGGGLLCCCTTGLHPSKEKAKSRFIPTVSCKWSSQADRWRVTQQEFHFLWKTLNRVFHWQSAFFSASSWTPCVGVFRSHLPAQVFLGGRTTSPTLCHAPSL